MKLYSTKNKNRVVDLKEAVLNSLPPDNGLYMPTKIPKLQSGFIEDIGSKSLKEIGFEVSNTLFQNYLPQEVIEEIIHRAINFEAPLVELDSDTSILELWHGPTMAFKDFGARFMANLMGHFNKDEDQELTILVATSGDTGGAVASGFLGVEGINIKILYPSGKVSDLQEKQLTTLGQNIEAYEVDGTFDDCQSIVKQAFLDKDLRSKFRLSSANSINIARLIPQSFYYFEAYKNALKNTNKELTCVVPSGNFGNLTAGLIGMRMGLPIRTFLAATNANDVVPQYLKTGAYTPKPSISTISNAMDVGAPSNFERMKDLFNGNFEDINSHIIGHSVTDAITRHTMKKVFQNYKYILDPHGAVGIAAWEHIKTSNKHGIIFETAHPAKFLNEVENTLSTPLTIPKKLSILKSRKKISTKISSSYSDFKACLN